MGRRFSETFVVTGTGTGTGKTVFTALLARHLARSGLRVAALKPVCSGGRADARVLRAAAGGRLPLDTVNPWHFREPLTPWLAARREGRAVSLTEVIDHVSRLARDHDVILVEGAGGLLSPLGDDWDTRELVRELGAIPVIVAQNRLGTLNDLFLAAEALSKGSRTRAFAVLMTPRRPTLASRTNLAVLRERLDFQGVLELPWIKTLNWPATLSEPFHDDVTDVLDQVVAFGKRRAGRSKRG